MIAGVPGERAWSDGRTITVDPDCDARRTVEAVVVQAALIGAGSLSRDLMHPLVRRERLRRRYLSIEGPRAVAALREFLPRSLDHLVLAEFVALSDSPSESLAFARTRDDIPESGIYLGALRPREVLASLRTASAPELDESNGRPGIGTAESATAKDDSAQAVSQIPMPDDVSFFSAGSGSTLIGRLLSRLLHGAGIASVDGPVGGNTRSKFGATGGGTASAVIERRPVDEPADQQSGKGVRHPEWDFRIDSYRPKWCTVRVVTPEEHPAGSISAPDLGLRRPLSRLGSGPDVRHRQRHGDDIDIDAAVEYRVGALAAQDPDDAFYLATVRDRRDLSVLILLDVSASTAELGVGRVRIHDHQRAAVAGLASTLHRLGDRVAVYAFSSRGRHDVRLTTLKAFAEHGDQALLMRLQHLQPSGYSRLGAAIRHGANLIEDNGGTTRRLLVVISDGLAFDDGYDLARGARDVRRALTEVRGRGTGCLCLTIGATGSAGDLRLVFGTAAHASVPRADQLDPVIARLFHTALRSVEVRRHPSTPKGSAI